MTTSAIEPRGAAPDAYAVEVLIAGCAAEVSLNDVPIVATSLERLSGSSHATPWVIDGVNQLHIVVARSRRLEILPFGAIAHDPQAGPVSAWARVLAGFYADQVPDPERDASPIELVWGPVDDAARTLPHVTTGTFMARDMPRWAWQDAPPIDPGAASERAEVMELLRTIHGAFERGDPAAIVARMPALIREAVHFSSAGDAFAAAFAGAMLRRTSSADHDVAPFREEDVVLRPIADGRMLRAYDASGAPLVRSSARSPDPWTFRVDVARIDGVLQLARLE